MRCASRKPVANPAPAGPARTVPHVSVAGDIALIGVPALAGLGGGIGGALLGGRISRDATREATRAAEAQQRKADLITARAAARLVRKDLVRVRWALEGTAADGFWTSEVLPQDSWDTQASVLARLLDDEDWNAVENAVGVARRHAERIATESAYEERQALDRGARLLLDGWRTQIDAGLETLNRYITIGMLIDTQSVRGKTRKAS
jgi:hypothetical protein